MPPPFVFAAHSETVIRNAAAAGATAVNKVLLGTYLIVREERGEFYRVSTYAAGRGGWVAKADVSVTPALKVFFVDVGQGDGALIECPQGIVVIDGGQGDGFHHFLRHRYWREFAAGRRVRIEAMIVSHPDGDHYKGLEDILEDPEFEVGTIYHNGLMRYPSSIEGSRARMTNAGHLVAGQHNGHDAHFIVDAIDTLADAVARMGEMPAWFRGFWSAAERAHQDGRLGGARRLRSGDRLSGFESKAGGNLKFTVLGPVLSDAGGGREGFLAFNDPRKRDRSQPDYPDHGFSHSHTRNGHSLVLRLEFGDHRFLLGGDLNIPAEQHLIESYGANTSRFEVDVAKGCHHGSADFSPEFLKLIKPHATVISSGDNKSFDHPTADAVAASARHSRGTLPLLFSTELARAYKLDAAGNVADVHYGLINLRSNGTEITMAQMKEQHAGLVDVWDSYTVPWDGRYWYERVSPPGS